jgi:integrase
MQPVSALPDPAQAILTCRELFDSYRAWVNATGRYLKNGKPTSQRGMIDRVLDGFGEFVGNLRVAKLREALLVRWRDQLEQTPKLTRRGINRKLTLLLSVLKWGRSRGMVSREVWADCSCLEPIKKGECGTRRERVRDRRAVSLEDVKLVAAASPCRHVAAMLEVQAYLGCRPGEVCAIRWKDIDKTPVVVDGVAMWTYVVASEAAKTAHHDKQIRYPVPPAAQAILELFPAPPAAVIFSPQASMVERGRGRRSAPSFGQAWTVRSYRNAVERACARAGVAYFSPHEVRHGALTRAAQQHGVLAAQRLANHGSAATTARYLHTDDLAAYRVAARIG